MVSIFLGILGMIRRWKMGQFNRILFKHHFFFADCKDAAMLICGFEV